MSLEETTVEKEKNEKEKIEDKNKPLSKKILSGITELLLYIVIAVVCIFVIPKYVVQRTEVSGPSMEATLQNEDSIMVEKVSYRFGKPSRFDIIVFYHFFDEDNQNKKDEDAYDLYVKRIIGLPGETVQIVGETILINGEPLEENYGKDPITYEGVAEEPIVLGDDEYFVLGDNREVSQDSRYEEVGNIKEDQIVGKAWVRVYPFNKMGFLAIKGL
ncbi:MAG: signal peptidase I [Lachnospiraceae bacterium]|nr:signal peptidase I [Lachnospiraceae bacterium]